MLEGGRGHRKGDRCTGGNGRHMQREVLGWGQRAGSITVDRARTSGQDVVLGSGE